MASKSTQVFITHSWRDIDFARQLNADLKNGGVETWFDAQSLQGGDRMAEEINRGLEWCDIYVPILSSASIASKWCWEEINAAITLSNDATRNGRPQIIPVLASKCTVPALLRGRLYFDFSGDYRDTFEKLLAAIHHAAAEIAAAPPAPNGAPTPAAPPPAAPTSPRQLPATFDQLLYQLENIPTIGAKDRLVREFANGNESPLIEESRVTFFYLSEDAQTVALQGDWTHWQTAAPMTYLPDTPLWYRVERFPRAARLEYRIVVNGHPRLDPRNPRTAPSGFGPNSELVMPDYRAPRELIETPIARGVVEQHWMYSAALKDRRTFWICLPPGYDPRRTYPVAYFNDGDGYLHFADLPRIMDFLISANAIKPFIAVLIKPNEREKEYARNNTYVRFLANELVPWLDDNYPTIALASARAIVGASLGALMAAHTARRRHTTFGLVACQSGAYSYQHDALLRDYAATQNLGIKFHFVVGEYETDLDGSGKAEHDLVAAQKRFAELLRSLGYSVASAEYPEGHQWGFWRAHLGDALKFFWKK